jgi:methionyl-tRNA synthetase
MKMILKNIARRFSSKLSGYSITTPIYYANACKLLDFCDILIENSLNHFLSAPHLGHLYSSVIADTVNRFQKLTTNISENIFSTGTDEHGIKVLQAASSRNVPVSTYCDNISRDYKKLFEASGVEFTDYLRTTEERHKQAVWKMWTVLQNQNAIYKDTYSGWYCISDETFLTESQLKLVGDQKVSIESGHPVEWTEEENYMFKLSEYQDDVIYWAKQE